LVLGDVLFSLAKTKANIGENEGARKLFKKAYKLLRQHHKHYDEQLVTIIIHFAHVLVKAGKEHEAISFLIKAFETAEKEVQQVSKIEKRTRISQCHCPIEETCRYLF